MYWYDIVELICSILSALSLISSLTIFCYYRFKKLSIIIDKNENLMTVFALALQSQIVIKKVDIYIDNKKITVGNFLYNGETQKLLDIKKITPIKNFELTENNYKKITVHIYMINNKTKKYIYKVRRRKNVCR